MAFVFMIFGILIGAGKAFPWSFSAMIQGETNRAQIRNKGKTRIKAGRIKMPERIADNRAVKGILILIQQ